MAVDVIGGAGAPDWNGARMPGVPDILAGAEPLRRAEGLGGLMDAISELIDRMPPPGERRFDEASLYGPGGPRPEDIDQDGLADCYFLATIGACAHADPQFIRDAISYDEATGEFTVRFYEDGEVREVTVTQEELADNIDNRGGGSSADDTGRDEAVWPAVMETAYAKMHDSDHADGLGEGYREIGSGGWPRDAMETVTGSRGDVIRHDQGLFESDEHALGEVYDQTRAALDEGRPVTLWSVEEDRSLIDQLLGREGQQDGLVDDHVYVVKDIYELPDGTIMVELYNPWAFNDGVEGGTRQDGTITVPLETLVETGGMNEMTVGPPL